MATFPRMVLDYSEYVPELVKVQFCLQVTGHEVIEREQTAKAGKMSICLCHILRNIF